MKKSEALQELNEYLESWNHKQLVAEQKGETDFRQHSLAKSITKYAINVVERVEVSTEFTGLTVWESKITEFDVKQCKLTKKEVEYLIDELNEAVRYVIEGHPKMVGFYEE
jgi:hypothetical protein